MEFDFGAGEPGRFARRARNFVAVGQQEAPPHILSEELLAGIDTLSFQMYTQEAEGSARWDDMQAARLVLFRAKKSIDRFLSLSDVSRALEREYARSQLITDPEPNCDEDQLEKTAAVVESVGNPNLSIRDFNVTAELHDASQLSEVISPPAVKVTHLDEPPADREEQFIAIEEEGSESEENLEEAASDHASIEQLQLSAERHNADAMRHLQDGRQKQGMESLVQRNLALIDVAEAHIRVGIDVDANERRAIQLQEFIGHVQGALRRL